MHEGKLQSGTEVERVCITSFMCVLCPCHFTLSDHSISSQPPDNILHVYILFLSLVDRIVALLSLSLFLETNEKMIHHDSQCSTLLPTPEIHFLLWNDEEELCKPVKSEQRTKATFGNKPIRPTNVFTMKIMM